MYYAVVLGSIVGIHLLALISPGPNVLIVTQIAMSRTRRAGIMTAVGIATGAALWYSAALIGLNVVFEHFAWLYSGLKLFGGAYLLYLGIKLWQTADHPIALSSTANTAVHIYGLIKRWVNRIAGATLVLLGLRLIFPNR